MNTDFSSRPLDYSSAEFKRIPLSTLILFYSTRISRISQIFSSGPFIFWTRIARIKRIFSIRIIGLFHPHGKSVSICEYLWENKKWSVCQKYWHSSYYFPLVSGSSTNLVFKEKIRVHPSVWQKHLLFVFVFKKNLCSSVQSVGE